jgi:hypothetical protein
MRNNNNNKTITHLSMPERQIPVLIDAGSGPTEGFMPSILQTDEHLTRVRRVLPSFVHGLRSLQRRKEIEKEYGVIDSPEWDRLCELLALIDRMNHGDWSPTITPNMKEALRPIATLLDRLSPDGWFRDQAELGSQILSFRGASDDSRLTIDIGEPSITYPVGTPPHKSMLPAQSLIKQDGAAKWKIGVSVVGQTAAHALSLAFTEGLRKTRFVIWWADLPKKLVPGLYCPDIVTALYASVLSTLGTPGGVGVCQRSECGAVFPRTRAKQRFCSHKCQVAAAMRRHRINLKHKADPESKASSKTKKRTR